MTPIDSLPHALVPWSNFYVLTGTAAATLTGLMFVAVTFGSSLVTKETAQTARAFLDPSYYHFIEVLLVACLQTMPTMSPTILGCVLVLLGFWRLVGLVWIFKRYHEMHRKNGDIELSDWTLSIVLPLLTHLLMLATGIGFALGLAAALSGLAIVVVSLLILGIHAAWELLVWMALAVNERRRNGEGS